MELNGFGPRLRTYRMRKGQSLQKLADAVGASKAHIYELETGRSKNPSLALLTALNLASEVRALKRGYRERLDAMEREAAAIETVLAAAVAEEGP